MWHAPLPHTLFFLQCNEYPISVVILAGTATLSPATLVSVTLTMWAVHISPRSSMMDGSARVDDAGMTRKKKKNFQLCLHVQGRGMKTHLASYPPDFL